MTVWTRGGWALIAVLCVACSSKKSVTASEEVGGGPPRATATGNPRVEHGFFVTDEAPPPTACTKDDDCIGDTTPDATGCCQDPYAVRPHSRAYRTWITSWRATACPSVRCPPPPSPSQPEDCLFEVRCAANVCANSCVTP